jgi:hypothetical protein
MSATGSKLIKGTTDDWEVVIGMEIRPVHVSLIISIAP